jgi:hypothetical protein
MYYYKWIDVISDTQTKDTARMEELIPHQGSNSKRIGVLTKNS